MRKILNLEVIKIFEMLFSLLVAISVFALVLNVNGYNNLFLVPLSYLILCLCFRKVYSNKSFAVISLHIMAFIKYVLTPLIIVLNKDYYSGVLTGGQPTAESLEKSIYFMIYEMVIVFLFMEFYDLFGKKLKISKYRNEATRFNVAYTILFTIGLVLLIVFKDYLLPKALTKKSVQNTQFAFSGAVNILYTNFKILLFLLDLQHCFNKYKHTNKFKYIILSGLVMLIYLILQFSTSRWEMLLPAIIYMYLCFFHFRKRFKIVAVGISIVLVVALIYITLFKFSWIFQKEGSGLNTVFSVLTQQFQEYFSGPRPVAQGFETIDKYDDNIDIETLFNDYVGTIPFVSHYINQQDRINIYYNWHLKGVGQTATQIMPIISIGYAYFTEFGAGILLCIYLAISMRIGQKESQTTNTFYKYIDCFTILVLNMSIYFNTQIVFGFLVNISIPAIVFLYFNNRVTWKKTYKKI
ncbi:MAG: hypothetical protein IJ867_08915 [Clostridia bacterium]|nr:hypothetical protein [Clostridia bacterium]